VEIINKPFLDMISATKINSKKRRAMLSHLPVKFAFFAISAILLLSGFLAIHSNQSAWAGTFPGPNGQIAFVRGEFEDPPLDEIYVMNADGSEQTRLTNNDVIDRDPTWSPDGEKIAFDSYRDGNNEIYVMNADDGSGVTRLTDGGDPTWSPDGEKIAFVSDRDTGDESDNNAIYVMNSADGSGVTRLTDTDAYYANPDWGTTTSAPGGPTPPQLAIDEAISTIQNLDNIPQSVKTNLIALLRQALDSLNNDDTTATTTATEEEAAPPMTQGFSTNTTTAIPSEVPPTLPFIVHSLTKEGT